MMHQEYSLLDSVSQLEHIVKLQTGMLYELNIRKFSLHVHTCTHTVIADAVVFIMLILLDRPLPSWTYPFIFYLQVDGYS